jgi:hypothetical protein
VIDTGLPDVGHGHRSGPPAPLNTSRILGRVPLASEQTSTRPALVKAVVALVQGPDPAMAVEASRQTVDTCTGGGLQRHGLDLWDQTWPVASSG